MIPLRPDTRHGHHKGGPRRTLDEAALRDELQSLIAVRYRPARVAERIRTIRRQLRLIENRSPHRHA